MSLSIIELCEQLAEANVQDFGDAFRPVLKEAATPQALEELESYWGHPLPVSYRDLMSLSNGIEGLIHDLSFLSVSEILEDNDTREYWEEFVPDLAPYLIAWGGGTGNALFLDPQTMEEEDEMGIVAIDADMNETRYPTLRDYLENALEARRSSIETKTRRN